MWDNSKLEIQAIMGFKENTSKEKEVVQKPQECKYSYSLS